MTDLYYCVFLFIILCGAVYFGMQNGKHTVQVREDTLEECLANGLQWTLAEIVLTSDANTARMSALKEGVKALHNMKANDLVKFHYDGTIEALQDCRYETTTKFGRGK